jgi:ADP-ribosyl-[dinitrogen reductase] hydrolase
VESIATVSSSKLLEQQIRAALLGLAVGDALGVPVEFQSRAARRQQPVVHMQAYGTHNQPAGTWSDDASLTFCLAEAIADGFSLQQLARNCRRWYFDNFWTPHGSVFDIGITTREAISRLEANPELVRAGGTDEYSNGNGSLMRILPLAFYHADATLASRFQRVFDVSAVTHGHVRSAVACFLYLEMVRYLRAGLTPTQSYAKLCAETPAQLYKLNIPAREADHFERILSGRLPDLPVTAINSGGYVMHTLEAALWCLLRHETFAETVLAAVNLGDDTDTTGAVTGGLAGLYYGEAAMPAEWLAVLARRADIEDLAHRMALGPGVV